MRNLLARLRQTKRHTGVLFVLALIPALGLLVNTILPPAHGGYYQEQALLLVVALGALWLSQHNPTGAIFLYCSLALLPVWGMVDTHQATADNWLALVYAVVPFLGSFVIAAVTRDERAVLVYALPMSIYGHGIGASFDEQGLSGALIMASALGTLGVMWLVNDFNVKVRLVKACEERLDKADKKARKIEGRQRRITGELENVQRGRGAAREHQTAR